MTVIGPSVEKALASVNGTLDDIMEIGRVEKPITESASLISIIDESLAEVFQIYHDTQIPLQYDMGYAHSINVEPSKIQRVISNIIGNAVQAMNRKGQVWLKSLERNNVVEVTIGNSGPLIPEEDLSKLFEAFYSKGKKGGTGLGLAIASKVVTAHGGQICCQYTGDRKFVEFVFTLPITEKFETEKALKLPRSSEAIRSAIATLERAIASNESMVVSDPREIDFENKIVEAAKRLKRPIVVDHYAACQKNFVFYGR